MSNFIGGKLVKSKGMIQVEWFLLHNELTLVYTRNLFQIVQIQEENWRKYRNKFDDISYAILSVHSRSKKHRIPCGIWPRCSIRGDDLSVEEETVHWSNERHSLTGSWKTRRWSILKRKEDQVYILLILSSNSLI